MEKLLILIGLTACFIVAAYAVMKLIDAVFFFRALRENTEDALKRIEDNLRKLSSRP
jgi:hypothetical protein